VRRLAAGAAALALLAAGCGGPNPKSVLRDTASNLGKIRSGTLDVHLIVTPQGSAGRQPFGFILRGPFRIVPGSLATLHVDYTQIASGERATATLVSSGSSGYVEVGGKRTPLTESQKTILRAATAQVTGSNGQLVVDRWVRHPKASVDGDVDHVTGELDAVAATTDLLALLRLSGRAVPTLTEADKKRLGEAVRDSSFDLRTGKDDKLLRDLRLGVDFAFDVPSDLKAALGSLVGAKIDFRLAVAHPNGHA
jgi:hypothetical protein